MTEIKNAEIDIYVERMKKHIYQRCFCKVLSYQKTQDGKTMWIGLNMDYEPDNRKIVHDIFAETEKMIWKTYRKSVMFYIR